jgi:hypothetical protein
VSYRWSTNGLLGSVVPLCNRGGVGRGFGYMGEVVEADVEFGYMAEVVQVDWC